MNVSNLNPTVLKVAMAGFIHDLGKFIDINCLDIPGDYLENNAGAFLPVWNGKYSHRHALHTAAFIESMSRYLPPVCNDPEWGKGEAFIRLACAHHRPDSPMEWIITQADHISSGMDRETFDNDMNESVHYKDYQKTRLIPVFSHIRLDETQENILLDDIPVRYPLEKMTPHSIFPGAREEIIPGSTGQARKEYERLTRDFLEKLTSLAHRHHDTALWFEHFDSLLMQYTSSIPAARVGHVIPDVSLYDHMATTSALAAALYLYHDSTETLDSKHIKDNTEKKFLLISGDLYGIQNFIFTGYGDTRRYRSKLLRGRSFSVSLMLEMTADMLCRKIGLPHSSVILNAGGRFTILAPNTEHSKDAVKAVNDHVNEWLVKRTFGETCIGLCSEPASGLDFQKGNIAALWERMTSAMEDVKFSRMDMDRHGGAVAMADYLEEFHNELSPGICPLCGKRPAEPEIVLDDIHVCAMCRDHVFLGEHLVKKGQLVICDPEGSLSGKRLLDPLFNAYQVLFPETDTNALAAGTEPGASWENTRILKYWEINPAIMDSDIPAAGTLKLINGYVPFYTQADIKHTDDTDIQIGMPKTLNHIAAAALENADKGKGKQGIAALGILKADVDHLGLIMACGLGDNLYTISRIATLSRQFNNYFAVHLPALLENNPHFNDVYTVFAGGDDLFLIGPWNRIVELAGDLQASFRKYVCENKEIHFSAGITVHKAHTPMDVLAAASEEALEMSKKQGRNRITVFDQTVTWQQFAELKNVADEMTQWLDQQWITQVFFYNINRFIDMAEKETVLLTKDSPIHMQDMACTRWRSLLGYSVERNTALKISKEDRTDKVVYIRNKIIQWLDLYRGSLRIPLWTILYNRR